MYSSLGCYNKSRSYQLLPVDYMYSIEGYSKLQQQASNTLYPKLHRLPDCYTGGGESEWGEREVAHKHVAKCSRVLELGGGAGSVSTIIQQKLKDPRKHVVVQPDERRKMFGGLRQLQKNKKACKSSYSVLDHIIKPAKTDASDVDFIYAALSGKPDCIVADCEGCLNDEYAKNPDLFAEVKHVEVERDDGEGKKYDALLSTELGMTLVDRGAGCGGRCATEVWERYPIEGYSKPQQQKSNTLCPNQLPCLADSDCVNWPRPHPSNCTKCDYSYPYPMSGIPGGLCVLDSPTPT